MQTCANCERVIGNLEARLEVDGKIVCGECEAKLKAGSLPHHAGSRSKFAVPAVMLASLGVLIAVGGKGDFAALGSIVLFAAALIVWKAGA